MQQSRKIWLAKVAEEGSHLMLACFKNLICSSEKLARGLFSNFHDERPR